jgi:dephospho-CoA kinase
VTRGPTVRIGITGPIGCGKSTVAGWLAELGAVTVDADEVARRVVEPGEPALETIFATFGDGVRAPDGRLDRAALGRLVFADPEALRRLEAIVHPAVRPRIEAAIAAAEAAGAPAVIVEAIKLVEGGLAGLCDETWLVTCEAAAQRERLLARGADPADAVARMEAQGDLVERLAPVATRVIDTTGPRAGARERVEAAYGDALAGAAARREPPPPEPSAPPPSPDQPFELT